MFTAAEALTMPKPYQLWNLKPAKFVVHAGSAIYERPLPSTKLTAGRVASICRAVDARMCFTSRQVSAGLASRISAIAPTVTGVADEVPFMVLRSEERRVGKGGRCWGVA